MSSSVVISPVPGSFIALLIIYTTGTGPTKPRTVLRVRTTDIMFLLLFPASFGLTYTRTTTGSHEQCLSLSPPPNPSTTSQNTAIKTQNDEKNMGAFLIFLQRTQHTCFFVSVLYYIIYITFSSKENVSFNMGGDDIGDDDYLFAPVGGDGDSSDDDQEVGVQQKKSADCVVVDGGKDSKRKRDQQQDESEDVVAVSKSKVESSKKPRKGGLLDLGRNLEDATTEKQINFLTKWTETKFYPNQLASSCNSPSQSTDQNQNQTSFLERFHSVVSKKKLKKWNDKSPMVLIVCVSARRAVSLLKELAPSKIRIAKLFAKHMTIEEQETMLHDSTFGIGVGTPHRLLTLAKGSSAMLSLKKTQLVILDTYVNPKNYSVYTLPDTAPDTQQFLKEIVQPEMKTRKDLRIAFL
jgi:hypothetical protein